MTLSPSQHLVVLALLSLDALARGLRVRTMVPMPLGRAVGVNFCGDAAGALTPAGLGADPVRFAVFQRSGASGSALLAAFVTEFGVGVVTIVAGAAILSGLFAGTVAELARRLAALGAPASAVRAAALVVVPLVLSALAAVRFRRHLPPALVHSMRDAWAVVRRRPPSVLVAVAGLTLVSLAARTAILPILAAGATAASPGMLIVGSFLLLLGQTVLPTPSGVGGVELGFLAGFSGTLRGGDLGRLLLVWRFYTLLLGLAVGVALLARSSWVRRAGLQMLGGRTDRGDGIGGALAGRGAPNRRREDARGRGAPYDGGSFLRREKALMTAPRPRSPAPAALSTAPLGSTGMRITRTGFGAWAIGGGGWQFGWGPQDDAASIAAIRHAVERGINWIDTAAVYGLGHSEEVVARALRDVSPNDRPFVFTKCGNVWDERDRLAPLRRVGDPHSVRREIEGSLRRLGVERIDLYQMHWPAEDGAGLEDYWGTLLQLKAEGKARAVGLSNHDAAQLVVAERIGHVDTLQPPFSAINRRAAASDLPWCATHGTGVIVYSPMHSGLLTGAFSAERAARLPAEDWRSRASDFTGEALRRNLALADALRPIARRHSCSVAAVAVAWTLAWPGVTGAIVGARSPEQVDGWRAAAALELSPADLDDLAEAIARTGAGSGPSRPAVPGAPRPRSAR